MAKRKRKSSRRSSSYCQYRPPQEYDLRKIRPDFETFDQAKARNRETARKLKGGSDPSHWKMAKTIGQCWKNQRCGEVLCGKCRRRYRMREGGETLRFLENSPPEPGQGPWMVTLLPADQRKVPGELHTFRPRSFIERVKRQLNRDSLTDIVTIGSVDFSYEVDADAISPTAWQPHLHFIVWGCSKKELQEALKRHYPATNEVKRPLLIKKVDDAAGAASYCFKPFFGRYTRRQEERGPVQALKTTALLELASLLDHATMNTLRMLLGVRQHANGQYARPPSSNAK